MPDVQERKHFHFEPVLTIGHLLMALTIAVGGTTVVYTVKADVAVVDTKISGLRSEVHLLARTVDKLATISIDFARQDEKIRNLERRLEYLTGQRQPNP